jgi:hypothetical protein
MAMWPRIVTLKRHCRTTSAAIRSCRDSNHVRGGVHDGEAHVQLPELQRALSSRQTRSRTGDCQSAVNLPRVWRPAAEPRRTVHPQVFLVEGGCSHSAMAEACPHSSSVRAAVVYPASPTGEKRGRCRRPTDEPLNSPPDVFKPARRQRGVARRRID